MLWFCFRAVVLVLGGSGKIVGAEGVRGDPSVGRGVLKKNWDKVTHS